MDQKTPDIRIKSPEEAAIGAVEDAAWATQDELATHLPRIIERLDDLIFAVEDLASAVRYLAPPDKPQRRRKRTTKKAK